MTGLQIAPHFSLPLEAVTETMGILAVKRAGKSNAAVVMAEEMYDAGVPWVAIDPKGDWWGIKAAGSGSKPGLSVPVFGGDHGDVPLEPTAGALVADLVADQHITCVLDVSEFNSEAEQRRFLTAFANRLYRRNSEPLHVFCEEADEYIPQMVKGEDSKVVNAFGRLVKRGGFRGIGVTLITQRSASLNKNVLTQVGTLFAMRTTGPQDRKAIQDWVEYHDAGRDLVRQLPGLHDGEAYVFSPNFLRTVEKIKFRRRRTFDSGATPKVGEKRVVPKTLADIDLVAIKEAMAETIEKAKAEDPKELRRQLADLRRQLADQPPTPPTPEPVIERIEVPVVSDEIMEGFSALAGPLMDSLSSVEGLLQDVVRKQREPAPAKTKTYESRRPSGHGGFVPPKAKKVDVPPDGIVLRAGARRMVESLGRMAPLRLTKAQWGTVSQMKTTSGTWSTYLGEIRRLGYIDENGAGFTLTDQGFEFIGGAPAPMTAGELQDHYRKILRAGAVRMLDALMEAYPQGLTREQLSEISEIASTSGTFSTYVGDLTRNGLAERVDGELRATDILMMGADA